MAYTHSQATATATTNGSSTSTSAVLTNNPSAGDTVCVGTFWSNGTATPPASHSVADGNANSYTRSTNSPSSTQGAAAGIAYGYYVASSSNGSKTVTVSYTNPGAGGAVEILVDDFAVSGGTSSFDQDAKGSGNATSPLNTPTVPVSGAGELAYCYACVSAGITSVDTPWTQGAIGFDGSASGYILSRGTNVALAMTFGATEQWDSIGMSFKIASGFTPAWGVKATHNVLGTGVQ